MLIVYLSNGIIYFTPTFTLSSTEDKSDGVFYLHFIHHPNIFSTYFWQRFQSVFCIRILSQWLFVMIRPMQLDLWIRYELKDALLNEKADDGGISFVCVSLFACESVSASAVMANNCNRIPQLLNQIKFADPSRLVLQ